MLYISCDVYNILHLFVVLMLLVALTLGFVSFIFVKLFFFLSLPIFSCSCYFFRLSPEVPIFPQYLLLNCLVVLCKVPTDLKKYQI